MALDVVAQQLDFSLGEFQSGALEREPEGAAETIVGLLGADGLPYRRGGSVYKSNAAAGAAGLLWAWDGQLAGGRRTVFAAADGTVYVLAANDATPTVLDDQASPGSLKSVQQPVRPVVVAGMLLIPSASPLVWGAYGGTRHDDYSTGSITVTKGSIEAMGTGTGWTSDMVGAIAEVGGSVRATAVRKVLTGTTLEFVAPRAVDPASTPSAYTLKLAWILDSTLRLSPIATSIAGRFVAADYDDPAMLQFSPVGDPFGMGGPDTIDNYYSLSGRIVGLAVLRDVLIVFTTSGVQAISGMAYPLVDPGTGDPLQRKELVNADVVAWGHEGIASWAGSLVVPALDNVYLMDSLGTPTPIGDRILDLYLSYIRAGYVPGVAEVYNGHYFLPVLNPASSYAWVDTLVCRLQPSHSGNNFAWTQLSGSGAEAAAFAERQTVPPLLLGASRRATSRVLDCSAFFKPAAAVKNDADGTAPSFTLTTIDYPTGNMVTNFVHHVRLMYDLVDAASDDPTISAEVSIDGAAFTALSGTAVEGSPGERKWRVNRHAKNVRFRFTVALASASCKVKSVEVFVRHSGRQ